METSLIIRTMDDAEKAARAMSASGFFADTKQASQAIVKILAGQELGFGPFASMTGVNIIQNKPVLAANLMAAAVKRTNKYNYRVTVGTDTECVITWFENGQEVGKSTFTIAEAQRAGLAGKDNWKKYPSDMLFARAISRGQKRYAPDIFNGATVYTPDELGATVDDEGNAVIDAKAEDVKPELSKENGNGNGHGNPDPIDDNAWSKWIALCDRAAAVDVPFADVDRERTTKTDLRAGYKELEAFVKDAEAQAQAA